MSCPRTQRPGCEGRPRSPRRLHRRIDILGAGAPSNTTGIIAELLAQARAFVEEGWATDVNELLAEALRRYLESHSSQLSETFIREDVEWGLNGDE